jgi:hypothetical protein
MHTNERKVGQLAVGLSARCWQREKALRIEGMAAGFVVRDDSAYEPSVLADCLRNKHFAGHFLPAAGNRWNGELNNAGDWGNYWSSTLNENNPNNAYNLNFNSGNANWNKIPDLRLLQHPEQLRSRLNSLLGLLSHYRSYSLRRRLFFSHPDARSRGFYLEGMKKYVL